MLCVAFNLMKGNDEKLEKMMKSEEGDDEDMGFGAGIKDHTSC